MTGKTEIETAIEQLNEAKRSNDHPTIITVTDTMVEGCWPAAITEGNYMSSHTQIVTGYLHDGD